MFWIFPTIIAVFIVLATLGWALWRFYNRRHQTYTIMGVVQIGHGLGRQTGAHTANLDVLLGKNIPKGLFGCEIFFDDQKFSGLLYHGYNSLTMQNCLEAHLFGFVGDIYGKSIVIKTTRFIRPQMRFNSLDELRAQIRKDLE